MKKSHARLAAILGSIAITAVLAACAPTGGSGGSTGGSGGSASGKVAFLMPDLASTRYEQQDSPLFTAKMKELCPACEVIYQNADSDPAKQQQQADSAIAQGVKVIVLDAVDTKAAASIVKNAQSQNIPVITYDRPIVDTPADFYVSFDNQGIGKLISTSLVDALKKQGSTGGVLIVNGSPTDDAAQLIKKGIHEGVDSSDYKVLAEFDTPQWDPQKAQDWVSGQVTQFGPQIVGVVAANDGTGGGTIAAFKAAGVTPFPLVTGNDAEIAAIQRIIAGDQYNTISKPIKIVAEAAAEAAYGFLTGDKPKGETKLFDTPSKLFTPEVVTKDNVQKVIFDGGIYTADKVCTGAYASACEALGIK
ncbi:ABC transporter substrate-binding protein [Glaciibacter flavus]|uniref:ABC transporter substrate-binding protein n=1 Tax=Orlajensenia flava TaxID=2565934 RepID=UPI003AFF68C3